MPDISSNSDKIRLVIDNNIFDVFTTPIEEHFPELEPVYLGEVFQEGQNIPDIPEKRMAKENREIVETMLNVQGYANIFPCAFPIIFYSDDVHKTAKKYETLGRTDAYLIAVTKYYPKPAILVTNDKKLISSAQSEGVIVASGHTIEDLKKSIGNAVQQLKELQHA